MKTSKLLVLLLSLAPAASFACDLPTLRNQAFDEVQRLTARGASDFEMTAPGGIEKLPLVAIYTIKAGGEKLRMAEVFTLDPRNCQLNRQGSSSVEAYRGHEKPLNGRNPLFE